MTIIQKASIEHLSQLATLFDDYRVFYGEISEPKKSFDFLSSHIQHNASVIYVSIEENQILSGFVQLYPIFSSTKMTRLWLLNDLFVAPEFRKRGISKLLINEAKLLCHQTNATGLLLETAKSNMIANNLYHKTNFLMDNEHHYYTWDTNR